MGIAKPSMSASFRQAEARACFSREMCARAMHHARRVLSKSNTLNVSHSLDVESY
jgi:hypothetical protein